MKNTSLIRSTSYWLLLVLSLASTTIGGWLVWNNTTTMHTTILENTATNVEVYVGQAWITSGSALLAAGIVGIFLSLVLSAAKTLISPVAPFVVEPIDWTAQNETASDTSTPEPVEGSATESAGSATEADATPGETEEDDQNGSSGSIATATNSSVK